MKDRIIVFFIFLFFPVFLFTGCAGKDEMTFTTDEAVGLPTEKAQDFDSGALNNDAAVAADVESTSIYVDICGAVNNPGVYSFDDGARVFEAVAAAGGFGEDASAESVNQAGKLTDGQKLYIMNQTEWDESGEADSTDTIKEKDDGKININTASKSELCSLPGIGETRAEAIIAYRESGGGFSTVEDIQKVSGIKSGTYKKICDLIKVR